VNPFQMKSMKVMWNMRNMMNKEFEHEEESWLIWVKDIMRMHSIRCISIRNQFRTKPMTALHHVQNMINKELESDEKCWYVMRHQNIDSISSSMNPK
jgi:hypothetical protein